MALWTPYADNTALDLSKPFKEDTRRSIQVESRYSIERESRHRIQEEPSHSYPAPEYPVYDFGYNYVPVAQASPLSGASVCSYGRPFTPQRTMTPNRVATLSPPMSPASQTIRSYSMIDDSLSDDPDFQTFEKDALRAMAEKNGGTLLGNNPRMRRAVRSNNESNDDSYRRQRQRNNFAAKQSRDRRKLREIHLALKVTYLRKEAASLKALLASRMCVRCHQSCRC